MFCKTALELCDHDSVEVTNIMCNPGFNVNKFSCLNYFDQIVSINLQNSIEICVIILTIIAFVCLDQCYKLISLLRCVAICSTGMQTLVYMHQIFLMK